MRRDLRSHSNYGIQPSVPSSLQGFASRQLIHIKALCQFSEERFVAWPSSPHALADRQPHARARCLWVRSKMPRALDQRAR
jgi:hypothetical protein